MCIGDVPHGHRRESAAFRDSEPDGYAQTLPTTSHLPGPSTTTGTVREEVNHVVVTVAGIREHAWNR
jgi:hypothetical protein